MGEDDQNEGLVKPRAMLVGRMGVCVLYRVKVCHEDLEKLRLGHYEPLVWFLNSYAPGNLAEGGLDEGGAWIDCTEPEKFGAERSHAAEPMSEAQQA